MKKATHCCLLFIVILLTNSLFARELSGQEAQQKIQGAEKIIIGTKSDIPEFIQFRKEASIEFTKFNSWAHTAFSLPAQYDFKLLNAEKDAIGMTHYRYQQTYHGFPIQNTMFIVHVKNNMIASMNGTLFNGVHAATAASMNDQSALSMALDYMNASHYRWESPEMEKQLKQVTGNPDATWFPKGELMLAPYHGNLNPDSYRLAYRFDVYADEPLKREYVFIDATTGEVIYTLNRIHTANSQATAVTRYSGPRTITADSVNATTFRLRETGRGLGIETYNIHSTMNYASATDFIDDDNFWNNVNVQQDEVATDAHWGAEVTYDFYQAKFARNSVDNAGKKLLSYVHYRTNYVNANWDGTEMNYGDGSLASGYGPLTCLDVTGHEISHGVTEFSSNLNYADESGALNEAFSDCMGNSIRQYGKNNVVINWLIGDEMGGTPFRSMANPNLYGNPDTYQGTNWDFATQEVHTNSGVMNYWYYLLTEGGSGTNDQGESYSVAGIGLDSAAAICYRMNAVYLIPTSQYADARAYAIQAAIDLFGPCTNTVIQTTNAWYAVGVGNAFTPVVTGDFLSPVTDYCTAPALVNFTNQSTNAGSFVWNFGDGSALSTAHSPAHTYTSFGQFTVTLVADGGACGIDTMTRIQYISVDTLNPCLIILPSSGTGLTQTTCTGQLFDSGGPAGNYQDNTNVTMTIAPAGANTVTLTFSSFNFESNFDYLYVYDGPTTASALIGQYSGNTLPNGGIITSSGSSITIHQTSDVGLTYSGFALGWQCDITVAAPIVSFSANDTSTCSGTIQFTDHSISGPTSWLWDFGDGDTSSLRHPSHTYAANGTYTVTLTASNVFGSDSSTLVNYITVNLPSAPASADSTACSGTSATLYATGSSVITWYDAPSGGNVVDTGSIFNTPLLANTTTYYVESDIYPAMQYAGPVNNSFGTGGYFGSNNYRNLIFDVISPVKLVSVRVYAQGAGNRTITLMQGGSTLQSVSANIPNGTSRVTLNWTIPAGTDFEIGIPANADLYRNQSGAIFPYTLSGVVTITGTNAGSPGYYYFFYDWELQGLPCTSARTPVTVTVLQAPVASYTSTIFTDSVVFTDNSTNATSWMWIFDDPASGANDTSYLQNPSHLFSFAGIHNVCLYVSDGTCTDFTCQAFLITGIGADNMNISSAVSVFPNPVGDQLSIQLNAGYDEKKCFLKLVDVLGQVVGVKMISNVSQDGKYDWNVSSLAPGAYMLEIEIENQKLMKRIIRQ